MTSLTEFATRKLSEIDARDQRRQIRSTVRGPGMRIERDGRSLISFSDNDYLGLSQHPRVIDAAIEATRQYGAGAGASRLVTGSLRLNEELETLLAQVKGTADAVVFGSGYLANIGIIPTLAGPSDLILADALCHACLNAGAALAGARLLHFRHNDAAHLSELFDTHRGQHERALVLTDGVFSMDGDLAPLADLSRIAAAHDAWLMTDDAHGFGVIGGGRGSAFLAGGKAEIPLQMGTLSKAVGAYGGYLAAEKPICDLIRNRARSLVYTTGLPPAALGAAIEAIRIIRDDPDLVARPLALARRFAGTLGLSAPESAIVPLILGSETRTMAAAQTLEDQGFLVSGIRPPTVPAGTARLRFTFSATHEEADVDRLAACVQNLGENL